MNFTPRYNDIVVRLIENVVKLLSRERREVRSWQLELKL